MVKEQLVKSLGRRYRDLLNDTKQNKETNDSAEGVVTTINRILPGQFKCWIQQFGQYPRIMLPLQIAS